MDHSLLRKVRHLAACELFKTAEFADDRPFLWDRVREMESMLMTQSKQSETDHALLRRKSRQFKKAKASSICLSVS